MEIRILTGGDNGLYIDAAVQNVNVQMLVDTGANITIISPRVLMSVPKERRPRVEESTVTVVMADGEPLSSLGRAEFELRIDGKTYKHEVWIVEIELDAILGYDFLQKHSCTIDAGDGTLKVGMIQSKEKVNHINPVVCRVRIMESVIIPAASEMVIPGKLTEIMNEPVGLIEPKPEFMAKYELMVAHAVIQTTKKEIPVRLLNPSSDSVKLYAGTIVAYCEPVDTVNHKPSCNNIHTTTTRGNDSNTELPEFLKEHVLKSCEQLETAEQKREVERLFIDYASLFAKSSFDLGRTDVVEHTIDVGDSRPIRQPPRRKPLHLREEEEKQVQEMLEKGIISPSSSPWSSGTVLVKKKSGEYRYCIDYRRVNDVTKKDSFPLPNIADHLDALGGADWFHTLDFKSGYWQVGMAKGDKEITAFSTMSGLYEFNVMPFGLCNAPATFVRLMERVLAGLNWKICLVYMDDIICPAPSFSESIVRLRTLFDRLQASGLKLNPKKCSLFKKEVEYLGHVISINGVRTDPKKISAMQDWPTPTCVTDVKSFVGMASYYRRFVQGFANIAKPLHQLTEKQKTFQWTTESDDAFIQLKRAMTCSPILAYPSSKDQFILDTDASHFACGAVLSQIQDGEEKVIAYFSKALTKEQRRYCVTRKELLAIVLAVKHFHHYLYGREFLVRTDHHALQWLRQFKHAEGQLARWIQRLETYNGKIIHRAGKLHQNADGMSRRPCEECRHCDRHEVAEKEAQSKCFAKDHDDEPGMVKSTQELTKQKPDLNLSATVYVIKQAHQSKPQTSSQLNETRVKYGLETKRLLNTKFVSTLQSVLEDKEERDMDQTTLTDDMDEDERLLWSTEQIRKAQADDIDIKPIISWKQNSNERPTWRDVSPANKITKAYWAQWDRLQLRSGILYRKWESNIGDKSWQLVVPKKMRQDILKQLHDNKTAGHLGTKRTRIRVAQRFYWHGSMSDVGRWCQSCDMCASRQRPHKTPRAPMKKYNVGAPLERIAIDVMGPLPVTINGNKYIAVIGDYFSKWTEAYAMPNQEATTVANIVVEEFICRFGVPRILHSDQGRNWESKVFQEVCRLLDIDKTRTTPYHPISDGMVERFNQTVEAMLSKFVDDNQKDWDAHLPYMMMAYRSAEHESTGVAPVEAMLGRHIELPIDLIVGSPPEEEDDQHHRSSNMPEYVQNLKERLEKVHEFVRERQHIATESQKRSYDHRATAHKYNVGDNVWLHCLARKKGRSPKLQRSWEGPYTVTTKLSDVTFRIQKSARSLPKVVHYNRLKLYEGRNPSTWFRRNDAPVETTQDKASQTISMDMIDNEEIESSSNNSDEPNLTVQSESQYDSHVNDETTESETDSHMSEEEEDNDQVNASQVYEVEDVVKARKTKDGQMEYLLKWKNFPESENTWQREDTLNQVLKDYIKQHRDQIPTSRNRGRPLSKTKTD